jgi:glycosyltransferase involved in cell wall biosynthesis
VEGHLSLIIPIHDEAGQLPAVLDRLVRAPCPVRRELVFVDDRSTDDSAAIVERFIAGHDDPEPTMRLLRRACNRGKGAAVRDGIAAATGEWILVQDADFEYDPADIPSLLQPLLDDRADVVYGSRFRREGMQVHRTFHFLVNRILTALSNVASGIYLSDMETCYKLFRADLLQAMALRSDRFGFEVEVTAYIAKARVRIFELPISYQPRTRLAGKKISWSDGLAALVHLVRFNLLTDLDKAYRDLPLRYRP